MISRLAEGPLHTVFGTFQELLYEDGQQESIALVMGQVEEGQNVLCRVHAHCLGAHAFNSLECDCREQMALAQALIAHEGRGLIIWLDQEGRRPRALGPPAQPGAASLGVVPTRGIPQTGVCGRCP
jgi:GTP cyclohydrolase II